MFAPEAAHPSRECPPALAEGTANRLHDQPLVVIGRDRTMPVPCAHDLRGMTSLEDMFAIVSIASRVICMDSGVLHMAVLLGTPAVAIFGGITPESRTHPSQHLVVLAGDVPCRPCDKNETCGGAYHCLRRLTPDHVLQAAATLAERRERSILVL